MSGIKHVKKLLIVTMVITIGLVFSLPHCGVAAYIIEPAAYWQLEDPGSPYDDAIGSNEATCSECPVQGNTNPKVRFYQDFDGDAVSGDEVDVAASGNDPGDAVFDWGADDSFTIAFWLRTNYTDVLDTNEVIIGRDDANGTKMQWWVGLTGPDDAEQGKVFFQLLENGWTTAPGKSLKSDAAVTNSGWHFIVAVRDDDAGENRLYVDGELQGQPISPDYGTEGFNSPDRPLNIGYLRFGNTPGFWYKGDVDEIAIYNSALTDEQIQVQYANGDAGKWLDESFGPTIVSDPTEAVAVGFTYMYEPFSSANPLPTYSLTDEPDGMLIDVLTNAIEWLPNNLQEGDHTFTLTAENSEGLNNQSVTASVFDLCDPSVGDMEVYWRMEENGSPFEDYFGANSASCTTCPSQGNTNPVAGFYQDFTGSAVGGDEVDVAASGNDPGDAVFDFGADDSFSIEFWMRANYSDVVDTNEVIIGRDDANGTKMQWWVGLTGPDDAEQGKVFFQLLENGWTTAPGKSLKSDNAVTDGEWHHVVAIRDDLAGQNLLYVDGELQGTPIAPDYGTAGFNSPDRDMNIGYLRFGNSPGFWYQGDVDEIAIYKTALPPEIIEQHYSQMGSRGYCNAPPNITTVAPTTATEYVEYTYTPAADDDEGDTLSWSLENEPDGMLIDSGTGAITWTPSEVTTSGDVTVIVEDGNGGADTEVFTVAVTAVNIPPEITSTAPSTATEGVLYTYNPTVVDPDLPPDVFTWSLTNEPSGMAINSLTGAITWTPAQGTTTSGTVILTVDDNNGGTDTELIEITVTGTNAPPTITSTAGTTATEGVTYTYNPTANDPDGDTLTWSLSNAPAGMTIDASTGAISWTPGAGVTTSGTVTLTVDDNNGGTDTEDFVISVSPSDSDGDGDGGGGSSGLCFIETIR